jgi:hypothetical protein
LPRSKYHGACLWLAVPGPLSGGMSKSSRFTGDDLCKDDPKFLSPRFEQYLAAVERLDRFALSSADFFSRNY